MAFRLEIQEFNHFMDQGTVECIVFQKFENSVFLIVSNALLKVKDLLQRRNLVQQHREKAQAHNFCSHRVQNLLFELWSSVAVTDRRHSSETPV